MIKNFTLLFLLACINFKKLKEYTYSANALNQLGGCSCAICHTQLSAWEYVPTMVQTEQLSPPPKGITTELGGNEHVNTAVESVYFACCRDNNDDAGSTIFRREIRI